MKYQKVFLFVLLFLVVGAGAVALDNLINHKIYHPEEQNITKTEDPSNISVPEDIKLPKDEPKVSVIPMPEVVTPTTPERQIIKSPEPQETIIDTVPIEPVSAAPTTIYMDKVRAIMDKYNIEADPKTQFFFDGLPPDCSDRGADACVVWQGIKHDDGTLEMMVIKMYLKPNMITDYLVIHETQHTLGITDECEADKRANEIMNLPAGSGHYC